MMTGDFPKALSGGKRGKPAGKSARDTAKPDGGKQTITTPKSYRGDNDTQPGNNGNKGNGSPRASKSRAKG